MDGLVLDVLEAETPELLGSSDVIERIQESARVELMDGNSTGAKRSPMTQEANPRILAAEVSTARCRGLSKGTSYPELGIR